MFKYAILIISSLLYANSSNSLIENINSIRLKDNNCSKAVSKLKWSDKLKDAIRFTDNYLKIEDNTTLIKKVKDANYKLKEGGVVGELRAITKFKIVKSNDYIIHFQHALENFLKDTKSCNILMNPNFKDVAIGYIRVNDGYFWIIDFASGEK